MTVQAIKLALKKLPMSKRMEIVRWVAASARKDNWDRQMEADAATGKLDFLVKQGKDAGRKRTLLPVPQP